MRLDMALADASRCFALVPCAGIGARSGAVRPKQYVAIAGKAMVAHTLAALACVARIVETLVVLSPDDDLFESAVPGDAQARCRVARCGGATRAETVANGLTTLAAHGAAPRDWVLVHDAARCLVRPEWIDRLIDACSDDPVGGLLALRVADTLKQERNGRVAATLDRTGKWAAQTPQMFRLGLLQEALARAGPAVTDEAGAVELLGHTPVLVDGDLENFKVTVPGDFKLAERLLRTLP
jgi:2-C-methyl-D-erythritol 4-phosphate cytidylyltransferase